MNVKELRIANIISYKGQTVSVIGLEEGKITAMNKQGEIVSDAPSCFYPVKLDFDLRHVHSLQNWIHNFKDADFKIFDPE